MSKVLTDDMYDRLKDLKTPKGYTLDMAIQPALKSPHLKTGIVSDGLECYALFKDIFDPLIETIHGYKPTAKHVSDMNSKNLEKFTLSMDVINKYVKSTRVRAGRAITGLSLPPGTNREDRLQVEAHLKKTFETLDGDLDGK